MEHTEKPEETSIDLDSLAELDEIELGIKIIENGRIITVSGKAKGHKLYLKRIRVEGEPGFDWEAEVDGYDKLTGDRAMHLFDKYYNLAKFKSRL